MARRRRHRRRRATGGGWGWLLGLGALVLFLAPGGSAFARPGGPPGQEPIGWWFNPETADLVWSWGVTPPGSGYRPASETERATYGQGML